MSNSLFKSNLINITPSHPKKPAKSLITNPICQKHITTFSQFLTTTILNLTNNIPFNISHHLSPNNSKSYYHNSLTLIYTNQTLVIAHENNNHFFHQQIQHVLKLLSPKTTHINIVNEEHVDPIFSFLIKSSSDEQVMSLEHLTL
jgi:hypothetical protein